MGESVDCKTLSQSFHHLVHPVRGDHQIQVQADDRLGVGVNSQATDDTKWHGLLLQKVQEILQKVLLTVGDFVHEFSFVHL